MTKVEVFAGARGWCCGFVFFCDSLFFPPIARVGKKWLLVCASSWPLSLPLTFSPLALEGRRREGDGLDVGWLAGASRRENESSHGCTPRRRKNDDLNLLPSHPFSLSLLKTRSSALCRKASPSRASSWAASSPATRRSTAGPSTTRELWSF